MRPARERTFRLGAAKVAALALLITAAVGLGCAGDTAAIELPQPLRGLAKKSPAAKGPVVNPARRGPPGQPPGAGRARVAPLAPGQPSAPGRVAPLAPGQPAAAPG